jgi:hypothetical protein
MSMKNARSPLCPSFRAPIFAADQLQQVFFSSAELRERMRDRTQQLDEICDDKAKDCEWCWLQMLPAVLLYDVLSDASEELQ